MTRLDPPPHRPNPRAWMEEARSRDDFTRRPGFREDRGHRESGYFSLGRAAGARSAQVSADSAPYRHLERGHPLFRTSNVEPKDTIPFRNPNLGVASERQIPEVANEDLPVEIPPPDPYEVAVEVEAQVGPRSPSPTPFKIAESLASNTRKGSSRVRSNAPSHTAVTPSGRFDSPRQGSTLLSRSSSPARSTSPFRRSEFPSSLTRTCFEGPRAAQMKESRARGSSQEPTGRRLDSGTLPRNFKAFAGSVKSQTSAVSDFRSALKKPAGRESVNVRGRDGSSSTLRLRTQNCMSRGQNGPTLSPTRRNTDTLRESHTTSPPRRTHTSQSLLRKCESVTSLNGRGHHGRCGSPIREGYDIENQVLLRNARNKLGEETDELVVSQTGRGAETQNHSILRKTQSRVGSPRGGDRHSPPVGRRNFEASRKADLCGSVKGWSRNSSPAPRSYEAPTQSMLRQSEGSTSARSRSEFGSLPSRRGYSSLDRSTSAKRENSFSPVRKNPTSRHTSPSRTGSTDPPGYSVLRNATNGEPSRSFQGRNDFNDSKYEENRTRSWRQSTSSVRSSSLSRAASPPPRQTHSNRADPAAAGMLQSSARGVRTGPQSGSQSLNDKRFSSATPRPSSPPLIHIGRFTSSQSSLDSLESGQTSAVSIGRTREEYAVLADVPKVKLIQQRGEHHPGRAQHQPTPRRQELFKPASHSLTKLPSREWDEAADTERDWTYAGSGFLSRAQSTASLQVESFVEI
ncbi:uncharacterized protein ACB058_020315 [Synchiropus picturatus]